MCTNPENVVDTFVLKEESPFQHPVSFGLIGVIFVIALYSFVLGFRTPVLADLVSKEIDQYQQLTYWVSYANLKVSTFLLALTMFLLLTPSLAIAGLFFFRSYIDGFYYNLILSAYAVGTSVSALLILVPVWLIEPSTLFNPLIVTYLPLGLVGIVILWIYEQYFSMDGIGSWIQVLSSYLLGCFLFIMLKSFSAGILGYFIFAVKRFLEIWGSV